MNAPARKFVNSDDETFEAVIADGGRLVADVDVYYFDDGARELAVHDRMPLGELSSTCLLYQRPEEVDALIDALTKARERAWGPQR